MNKNKKDSMIIDYLIVLLYFLIVAFMFWVLITRNDFCVQYVLPYGLILATSLVFVNYLSIITGTIKKSKDK